MLSRYQNDSHEKIGGFLMFTVGWPASRSFHVQRNFEDASWVKCDQPKKRKCMDRFIRTPGDISTKNGMIPPNQRKIRLTPRNMANLGYHINKISIETKILLHVWHKISPPFRCHLCILLLIFAGQTPIILRFLLVFLNIQERKRLIFFGSSSFFSKKMYFYLWFAQC